jgi:ATP-dependent Clp protease ATP-binding subunit ClpA
VLELSLREALQLGHSYIGTEHLLLGLIREGEGVAAQVLTKLGADTNKVRQQVVQLLSGFENKETVNVGGENAAPQKGSQILDQFGTSPRALPMASLTQSLVVSVRSSASCRFFPVVPKTTRY